MRGYRGTLYTILESYKQSGLPHYEGWGLSADVRPVAEAKLVVADEFRDGNVPPKQGPLSCAQLAFAALPDSVQQRNFQVDSACHESGLLGWLCHLDGAQEPGGPIGFVISAVVSPELEKAVVRVPEWAQVAFVPIERYWAE